MEPLSDGEITLRLSRDTPAEPTREWLRALHFDITLPDSAEAIGLIDIRLGYTLSLVRFGGHFGYNVKPEWRGHHYAGKACKLFRQIAIAHVVLRLNLSSAISRNRSFFGRFFSHTTAPLPRRLRPYADTPIQPSSLVAAPLR